jgi:hypothetical protein
MNEIPRKFLSALGAFVSKARNRRLTYLVVIGLIALGEFLISGLARRTFVFYSSLEGKTVVEDRMLHRSGDRETDIRRYVEEVLLGPSFPELDPLFYRGTKLSSFMYRETVVYADLSESAALPVEGNWDVFRSLLTLNEGIRRNFPFVGDVRLFIGGNETFFNEFSGIFAKSADNSKTPP